MFIANATSCYPAAALIRQGLPESLFEEISAMVPTLYRISSSRRV